MQRADQSGLEQGLDRSPWAWLETLVVTAGPVLLAMGTRPSDPLFVTSDFPWLVLAPLLVGLRYGFAHGFASGATLGLAMVISDRMGWSPRPELPGARIVGILVVGMLAGELADRWLRRLQRLRVVSAYRRQRLDEFARAYHLLKVSHDRLEEHMVGNTTSLRGALLQLRRKLISAEVSRLEDVGDAILDLYAEHGWVQVAGLHRVTERGKMVAEPVAKLGAPPPLSPDEPIVVRALETRALVTVRELARTSGPLAAIPLEDVEERLVGVAVVHEMPFVAFTEEHLHLLVVLGGHTADLLSAAAEPGAVDPAARDFQRALRRAQENLQRYGLPASLVAVSMGAPAARLGVDKAIEGTKRGLDVDWKRSGSDGRVVLFLVMPLTDAAGVQGYDRRVRGLLKERFAGALGPEEVVVLSRPLARGKPADTQLAELGRECGFAG